MLSLLIFLISLSLVYIAHFYYNVSRYPKGPFPLPFIGNLYMVSVRCVVLGIGPLVQCARNYSVG